MNRTRIKREAAPTMLPKAAGANPQYFAIDLIRRGTNHSSESCGC